MDRTLIANESKQGVIWVNLPANKGVTIYSKYVLTIKQQPEPHNKSQISCPTGSICSCFVHSIIFCVSNIHTKVSFLLKSIDEINTFTFTFRKNGWNKKPERRVFKRSKPCFQHSLLINFLLIYNF